MSKLHEIDAAHPRRRREPREIADDAAAERDHGRIAARAEPRERIEHARRVVERLRRFAGRQHDRVVRQRAERALDAREIEGCDAIVGDDERMASAQRAGPAAIVEETRADPDRIAPLAERDVDLDHAAAPALPRCQCVSRSPTIWRAVCALLPVPADAMRRSAISS